MHQQPYTHQQQVPRDLNPEKEANGGMICEVMHLVYFQSFSQVFTSCVIALSTPAKLLVTILRAIMICNYTKTPDKI